MICVAHLIGGWRYGAVKHLHKDTPLLMLKLDTTMHTCNPSAGEAETRRYLGLARQPV